MKKKLKIGRAKRDRMLSHERSELWCPYPPLGGHHNRKAKHKFRAWNLKDATTKKETKEMIYFPYAPTCPPLQGYEGARTGYELWQPPERGLKKPKNGKPFQERPSRCRCPRARQPNTIKKPTKKRARGHTLLFFFMGGYNKLFEFASLRANSNNLLISYTNLAL